MCGIAGVLRFDGAAPDRAALERMGAALLHRGPDDAGLEILGPAGLVHRRLSIIDLSAAGRQPMVKSGRTWLCFNGEVYNYLELRRELQALGQVFTTDTDSEVVMAAWERWGEEAFPRFNGMWALALWDMVERKLVLSRDRLGKKPLVFARSGRRLLFASEAKALLAAEPELSSPDLQTIAQFLERPGHVFQRSTFYEKIERLEPATTLTVFDNGRSLTQRYWKFLPPARPREIGLPEAAERVRETLTDAIRLRFRADVPVGTCLSGGLDSSSIVALAQHAMGRAPRTYSVVYDDPEHAEGEYVQAMVQAFGLESRVIHPDGKDLAEVMVAATRHQDQPTGAPGIYSQWQVMKLAGPEVRVLLDGQGGDELFAGYYTFYLDRARTLLDRGVRGDLRALEELLRERGEIRALSGLDPWSHLYGALVRKLGAKTPAAALASPELEALAAPLRAQAATPKVTPDALLNAQWDMLVRTVVPSLLHYEDADSMAFSIEARVPFLDVRMVELAFSLPSDLKLQGATNKRVLREAMRGILPEKVRLRSDKKGFPTPFAKWIRAEPHRSFIEALLLGPEARGRGYTSASAVGALWEEHREGRADHSARIWQLATLELFLRGLSR
ncbi:MAG: asparagine synthase (glutamine-hydrolyzing) [Myxococcota bacterium]